jgi:branched-chain amino acid transport system substrate-binding protein
MLSRLAAAVTIFLGWAGAGLAADITVGFVTSQSGPGASIGIPYGRGILAGHGYIGSINGQTIKLIRLDDASDPSAATRNARKLVEEDKVDILIGTSGVPGTVAMAVVANETKTPMISLTPINPQAAGQWLVAIPQPPVVMVKAVVDQMKKDGVKRAAYIGFSDAWGDLVYDAVMQNAPAAGIEVVTNERYARPDTSVTGQTLKIIASRPDAVITGGSGTPGALPYLALAERSFKGGLYGNHGLINPDFVRVGGAAVEGVVAPTGPVVVAEQLPDSNPIKKVSLTFRDAYQKANSTPANDAFAPYAFDGWLVFADAAKRARGKAQPGTPQFRQALREAIGSTNEVVGTHGVYNFKEADVYGVDERSRVLVRLTKGEWKLMP